MMFLISFHWSLVIIQTRHKGLLEQIILHFDSLTQGHNSNVIFGILIRYVEKSCSLDLIMVIHLVIVATSRLLTEIFILLISFEGSDFT